MENAKSGIIRKRKVSYTQVSNIALRDENLSLKAKGLLSIIESYLTLEDFVLYKNFLMKKSSDGKTAFESAWQDLKKNGYLVQYKLKDPKTKQFYYEYEIVDNPKQEIKTPDTEKQVMAQKPDTDFLGVANLGVEKPYVENLYSGKARYGKPPLYNNTLNNNTLNNNTILTNILTNIQTNIDYFTVFVGSEYKEEVDNIINIIVSVVCLDTGSIKINGSDIPIEVVKGVFEKIRVFHVQYVLDVLHTNKEKIKNMRNFILSTLYNSVSTLELYYTNLVNVNEG